MATIKQIVRKDKATGIVVSDVSYLPVKIVPNVRPRTIGLGDLVATFARPVAIAIDKVSEFLLTDELKTALASCPGCNRRHRKMNLQCPDILVCPFIGRLIKFLPGFASDAILAAAKRHAKDAEVQPEGSPLPQGDPSKRGRV